MKLEFIVKDLSNNAPAVLTVTTMPDYKDEISIEFTTNSGEVMIYKSPLPMHLSECQSCLETVLKSVLTDTPTALSAMASLYAMSAPPNTVVKTHRVTGRKTSTGIRITHRGSIYAIAFFRTTR